MRFCEGVSTSMLSSSPKVGRYVEGDAMFCLGSRWAATPTLLVGVASVSFTTPSLNGSDSSSTQQQIGVAISGVFWVCKTLMPWVRGFTGMRFRRLLG